MDQDDLKQIGELVEVKVDTRLSQLEDKLLKWKSEIIDAVDVMASEMRDERDFRDIGSHQINSNTRRIEKLETKVFGVSGNV